MISFDRMSFIVPNQVKEAGRMICQAVYVLR